MDRRQDERGMTLVELMVTCVLVAVGLVGTIGAVFSAVVLQEKTTRKRSAMRAVSSLVAELRASDFDTLVASWDGTTRTIDDGGGKPATATLSLTDVSVGTDASPVYRVAVAVTYANGDLDEALSFVAHLCDHRDGVGAGGAALATLDPPPEDVLLGWVTQTEDDILSVRDPSYEPTYVVMDGGVVTSESVYDGSEIEDDAVLLAPAPSLTDQEQKQYDELRTLIELDYQ